MTDSPEAARPPIHILLVDDELRNRELFTVILEAEGYLVEAATTGEEALERISAAIPDLVLLDVMMPGLDGYQVASRIRASPATAQVPIILLTSLHDSSSRSHGMSAGANEVLAKPVSRADLCTNVKRVLERRP